MANLEQFLQTVMGEKGKPYVFGDTGPKAFDCSGLVFFAAKKAGYNNVPRTSEEQWRWVDRIQKSQLQPGDLVFTQWPGDNAPPGHVQVYIGNGKVIGADDQAIGVAITSLAGNAGHIVGYGRLPGKGGTATTQQGGGSPGGMSLVDTLINPLAPFLGTFKSLSGTATGVADSATAISSVVSEFQSLMNWITWLFQPSNWVRIGAGIIGLGLFLAGATMLVVAAQ